MAPFALVRSLKRQHASQAAGFAAVTIAAAVFIDWWGGLPMLSNWGSGFATMKPVTALCLTSLCPCRSTARTATFSGGRKPTTP
jgi:hypothetical protein